jgi:hypothetical protein
MMVICNAFSNIAYSLLVSTLLCLLTGLCRLQPSSGICAPTGLAKDSVFLLRKTDVLPISCHGRILFSISFVCAGFSETMRQLFLS